ncbi:MAG TPA: hypothetical protein VHW09_31515 [Bryobacteraceae bacterium]|jgi:hypothetical protein|nr:hypothetical protein [Bryobacteraceae bacterium]
MQTLAIDIGGTKFQLAVHIAAILAGTDDVAARSDGVNPATWIARGGKGMIQTRAIDMGGTKFQLALHIAAILAGTDDVPAPSDGVKALRLGRPRG